MQLGPAADLLHPDRVGLIVRGDSEDGFPSVFTENTIAFVFADH